MDKKTKLALFKDIARLLNQSTITWAIGGSLLLYAEQIVEDFNDIDLFLELNDDTQRLELEHNLTKLGAKEVKTGNNKKFHSAYFKTYNYQGLEIDLIAGFGIYDSRCQLHYFAKILKMKTREYEGVAFIFDSLAAWYEYYSLMDRKERVALIEKDARKRLEAYFQKKQKERYIQYNLHVIPAKGRAYYHGLALGDLKRIIKRCNMFEIKLLAAILDMKYYEEIILQGLIITQTASYAALKKGIIEQLKLIDNWATADNFALSIKIKEEDKADFYCFLKDLANSHEAFQERFICVSLLKHYRDSAYLQDNLALLAGLQAQNYYARSAKAWFLATIYPQAPTAVLTYLAHEEKDREVIKLTLRKIAELKNSDRQEIANLKERYHL